MVARTFPFPNGDDVQMWPVAMARSVGRARPAGMATSGAAMLFKTHTGSRSTRVHSVI